MSNFEKRVQINKIIESQLPEFLVSDFPKAVEFLRQYYISEEFQGGNVDLADNLDQYLKLDNLVPEVIVGQTRLSSNISESVGIVTVTSTKGFPSEYGLLKIDNEIITYTGITTNTFTGCIRGFSGVTGYNYLSKFDVDEGSNKQSLVFEDTEASSHTSGSTVQNLSVLFLQEFYKKLKYTFTPGLENNDFVSDLDVGNFIKHARDFYQSKGIEESVKILFKVLYGVNADVIDLESRLIKPSSANYIRREIVTAKNISGDPLKLEGQTIFKSTDINTNAAISNVEILTRDNETFYKLELFVGYDEKDLIQGTFTVPGKTKVLENVSVGSSIISVDSTIGFPESGVLNLISDGNSIKYTSKSVNQFFGCSGISSAISLGSDLRSDETIYGYENGNISKRVDLRITGVVSDLIDVDDSSLIDEGEEIVVRNLGNVIENPQSGEKTYKEVFANTWIYNTSTRYQVRSIAGSTFTLYSFIDKSSLSIGDNVDILVRSSNTLVFSNATVTSINTTLNQIILSGISGFTPQPLVEYDIRRKIKKSSSLNVNIDAGNNSYISNVLNLYTDKEYGYVASNSLPSYQINDILIESSIPDGSTLYLSGANDDRKAYSSIKFPENVNFIDGDVVVYTSSQPLSGLTSGSKYYVRLLQPNEIRLYESRSLLDAVNLTDASGNIIVPYLFFGNTQSLNTSIHRFTLVKQENRNISANKILRKFPLQPAKINNSEPVKRSIETISGGIGILIDGVEITNPESIEKVYYGPLKQFDVLNNGDNYDIVNPPRVVISTGAGTTALVEPVISGTVKNVFVDPQDFDIDDVVSISLTGANGSGCILEPIIGERFREVEFDSRSLNVGGGVDLSDETITFLKPHNFYDGEPIIYNQNGNPAILTGSFQDVSNTVTGALVTNDQYIAKFVNTRTIRLFNNINDFNAGINTVGFSTLTTFGGIHKFRTLPRKTLRSVKVLNGGSGYTYRKLRVKSTGISTEYSTINYENHGFSTGEVIHYSTTGTAIVGLSTLNSYSVDVVDTDSFKLINVGIGATFQDDLSKNKHVSFQSTGSGYHIFEYPPVTITANVSYGSTFTGAFNFTPIVSGSIINAYLYESGSGYGSTTLNLHKKPTVTVKNGKNAELKPIISNGRVIEVQILSSGYDYYSTPEISVQGNGSGAIIRPVISNGLIVDAIVLNQGLGYDPLTTTIKVTPRGSGAIFDVRVRDLTLNDAERYAKHARTRTPKIFSSLSNNKKDNSLVYGIYGYSQDLANNYSDIGNSHSPIIGWAYDGNPIYGPYGFSRPNDVQSGVRIINSSYVLDTSSVFDRPAFPDGFFIDDYRYASNGDLDVHNGRFCKTPEFPNGTYAYFAGITTSSVSNTLEPRYPYFIGNTFKSSFIEENSYLDQSFDFNNSNLIRNTYPYKINDRYAGYDFLVEPYERFSQVSVVESVSKGFVNDIKVNDGGSGYKIGDRVIFDESNTGGYGLRAEVSELIGKNITKIETSLESYSPCVLVWDDDNYISAYYRSGFNLRDNDTVLVGSISTSISDVLGSKKVGFSTQTIGLAASMTSYSDPSGKVEDIFISSSATISIGNSISIQSGLGSEIIRVLNVYDNGILRVKRFGTTGVAHSFGTQLNILSDKIKIPAKTRKFTSEVDNLVYFNAKNSVGIGTTLGGAVSKTFTIGGISETVSVPYRSIYIPNHPFKTGQRLTFEKSTYPGIDSLIVGDNPSNLNTFQIPDATSSVYVINKGKNYIGLVTQVGLTTNSEGLFFYSDGSNNSEYSLETNFTQITAEISKVVTTISVGQTHGLSEFDTIKLNVVPNTVVGLGTTGPVSVKFNEFGKKLLLNSIGINSSQINTVTNTITIPNHGYNTGDKVFYDSTEVASGLSTGSYFVIKTGTNTFKLAETLYESQPETENIVNIVGTGASVHNIGLINPQINVVKNSTLKFDISDSSLRGYNFKIYQDKEFKNEFLSTTDNNDFNVTGIGTIGFGTASLSIKYSQNVPSKLYYALEKSGYISTADNYFSNHSEINYVNSEYNGTYSVFGISTSSFKITPARVPSVLTYNSDQVEKIEYSTKSSTALNGSIGKLKIISEGFGFKKLPKFVEVISNKGSDANLVAISTDIGKIKETRFKTIAYEYPSDKTLNPEAVVSPIITLDNFDTIGEIDIVSGGSRYVNAPDLLLFDDTTKQVVDNLSLIAVVPSGAIADVIQVAPIYGLKSNPHKILAINNSNGVGISSMITDSISGIATCTLSTPILGFSSPLFNVGDEIYVEGIELVNGSTGTGYNSDNYGYRFFKVASYTNTNPAILSFAVVDELGVGLSTNPGIAKTFQSGYATIINKKHYPVINVIKKRGKFLDNEQLFVDSGRGFLEEDLYVKSSRDEFIKVNGTYNLKPGNKIRGRSTGVVAEVVSSSANASKFRYKIDYSTKQKIGWSDDIGKISEDYQVTPDNDYYQNLSYTIKSPITWDKLSGPVNSIIHPAGLKNFADVGIVSSTGAIGLSGTTNSIVILDVIEEKRVDTINNFDNTVDYDIRTNPDRSKYLKLQNRKLTDYTECRTNRVIIHDDISNRFSSRGFEDPFVEIEEIDVADTHVRYVIQVVDPDTFECQISELVLQTTTLDSILFEKYTEYSKEILGYFSANVDLSGRKTLVFTPTNRFTRDHDIKILKKTFDFGSSSGIGTQSFGSVNLIGSNVIGISSIGSANNVRTIAQFSSNNFNGLFANIEIINNITREVNYIDAALDFDGSNTYLSEYYFDSTLQGYSSSSIGLVTAIYDSTSGIVSFRVRNEEDYTIDVRTSIVGFGSTGSGGSGIGTYRFSVPGQPDGSERSARLESTVGFGTNKVRVGIFESDLISSLTSIVRVSCGNSSAIHQVSLLKGGGGDIIVSPGPFAATNNTTGLGTFGSEVIGNQFLLNFYPDFSNATNTIQAFNEVFYTFSDFENSPIDLNYGKSSQKVFLSAYDGINGTRANKVNFNLTHNGRPIYKKVFNPSDSTVVNFATGVFTITDHMFNTGEELIYTPKSSFIGVGQSAIGIGSTANYLGIVTNRLPERVYPIALTPDTFKLATRRSYANLGIAVTFTDAGLGNAHEFEMTKKLSKSVVSLDGIVQQPITFTPISHTLQYNSGSISVGIATFNLSGITSIQPRDLIKIDDEYMKVVEVGFSTNVGGALLGPINGIIQAGTAATIPTISVVRASVGSAATTHSDGANVQVYRGSFNIVGSEIWFVDPPKGNTRSRRDESNLPYVRAQYAGRTFLRSNYDTNMIFDDISDQFTGIGKTYTMTVEGINTTGVSIGNGILFINGVFQTPTTINNSGNNYEFQNDNIAGISSVVFTGITSTDGTYIKSDFDINQNQLPRGGLIVSLGSTPGLGYAPLLGAKVRANLDGSGSIVSITGISHTGPGQSISTASYNNQTGIVEITTTTDHNFVGGDRIKLVGLGFTCPSGAGIVSYFPSTGLDYSYDIAGIISARTFIAKVGTSTLPHSYIGFGTVFPWYDLTEGSGYRSPVSIGITDPNHTGVAASITAVVGAGGTLGFIVNSGGSGYVNPYIKIPEPNYENIQVVGVSRVGVGTTTETGSKLLLNIKIGPARANVGIGSTLVGISYSSDPQFELERRTSTDVKQTNIAYSVGTGSTLFQVESFEIARNGYAFQVGDVFKPIGLVTAKGLSEPISEFKLEVVETFQDYFSAWSFGEMNYIDSTATLQNGSRTRFPLIYNGQLLSFEIDPNNPLSSSIDLDAVLLIFVNGVIQEPGYAYKFIGGTSFEFTEAPKASDKVDIFFYLGQNGVDITLIDINETIKIGDEVFVGKHPNYQLIPAQDRDRTILDITGSDIVETDNYVGFGINESNFRPIEWTKQKKDKYIKGDVVYKSRDSIEPFVYPTAKIIGNINSASSEIFVDDAQFFNFEENNYGITINSFDALIVDSNDPVSAAFTATVSIAGTISNITITNAGLGYSTGTIPVKISSPPLIGVGVGTTATATATISNGSVVSVSITNPGLGYTIAPSLLAEIPKSKTELIKTIANVQGFSGIITGITTTTGIGGHPLALKINFRANASDANDLQVGYPILVYNTKVGNGVTSVNSGNASVVGIGTSFLDNVYIVNAKTNAGPNAEIICNIDSSTTISGIPTTGSLTLPLGNISWGRIYNFGSRTNPVSIGVTGLVVDSGLSTFPTIQRRTFGLRNSGAIRKLSNLP
jgi:hypothetical protein